MERQTSVAVLSAELLPLDHAANNLRMTDLRTRLAEQGIYCNAVKLITANKQKNALMIEINNDQVKTITDLSQSFGQNFALFIDLERNAYKIYKDGGQEELGKVELTKDTGIENGFFNPINNQYYRTATLN